MSLPPASTPFTFTERLGMFIIVEAAGLSAAAVTLMLTYMGWKVFKNTRQSRKSSIWLRLRRSRQHDSAHMYDYFLSLMIFELIQAIGGLLTIKWMADAVVSEGAFCTAQGVLKQMGNVGVALVSIVIAIHTFCVLAFRWRPPAPTSIIVLAVIWIFVVLIAVLGIETHKGQGYFGSTHYWCWISFKFRANTIALEYAWLWIALLLHIPIYVSLALILQGTVNVGNNQSSHEDHKGVKNVYQSTTTTKAAATTAALQMLLYPTVYFITVSPLASTRFMQFNGKTIPFGILVFSDVLFSLSGIFNVALYATTRIKILSGDDMSYSSDMPSHELDLGRLPDI